MNLSHDERNAMTEKFRRDIRRVHLEEYDPDPPQITLWKMMAIALASAFLFYGPVFAYLLWKSQ